MLRPLKPVTSRQNPIVARFRTAARGEANGLLLLDGIHLVNEALDAGIRLQEAAVAAAAESRSEVRALLARLDRAGVVVVAASQPVMDAISPVNSSSIVVALADRPKPRSW
jgi:RNA methyltransferase, TrmH family